MIEDAQEVEQIQMYQLWVLPELLAMGTVSRYIAAGAHITYLLLLLVQEKNCLCCLIFLP